eukprot:413510-Prorocentrum_minimum.AAC.1
MEGAKGARERYLASYLGGSVRIKYRFQYHNHGAAIAKHSYRVLQRGVPHRYPFFLFHVSHKKFTLGKGVSLKKRLFVEGPQPSRAGVGAVGTAPPLNTGRRFEPWRGRWRSEGW